MQKGYSCFNKPLWIAFVVIFLSSTTFAFPSLSPSIGPVIAWSNCTEADPPNLQCGQIQVPIDYQSPHGDKINLTFARLQSNTTARIGSLIFNPGGPGGAASSFVFGHVFQDGHLWTPELLAHYDLIGLDPRGTGLSNPMICDQSIWNQHVSSTPQNDNEYNQLVARNKAFSESCKNGTGPLLDFMDTTSTARDLDMVRRALREEKLNFMGLSYGSKLGTTYAGLFPRQVGRMVLDGIYDTFDSDTSQLATESGAYENTLNRFFTWCNTTSDCALNGQDAPAIFDNLIASADTNPIQAPGCSIDRKDPCRSIVTGEEILVRVQTGLLGFAQTALFQGWPALSDAIAEAAQGNATLLSSPIKTAPKDSAFSFLGVSCKDNVVTSQSYIDLVLKRQMTGILSPHSRGNTETYEMQSYCIGWISPPTKQKALDPKQMVKLPNILLVNSFHDPSTSIAWANSLRLQMPTSVLILRNGSGHTSYFTYGKTSKAMDNFLLTGELPAQGTVFDS